jgi:hypothetical protein
MKHRLVALMMSAVLLLAGCTVWREHQVSDFKEATGGEGLERSFWKEVKGKHWNTVESHLAGTFISFTPEQGRMDRAATLAYLQQLQLDDFSLGDLETELNTETVVVTYSITMRGRFAGQPLPSEPVHMMTVWQKEKPGWMAIAHSVLGPTLQKQ